VQNRPAETREDRKRKMVLYFDNATLHTAGSKCYFYEVHPIDASYTTSIFTRFGLFRLLLIRETENGVRV
jgi:hypothetical protein